MRRLKPAARHVGIEVKMRNLARLVYGSLTLGIACSDAPSLPSVGFDAGSSAEAGSPNAMGVDAAVEASSPVSPMRAPFGLDTRPSNTTCLAWERSTPSGLLTMETPFPSLPILSLPVEFVQAPSDNAHVYSLSYSGGRILRWDNAAAASTVQTVATLPSVFVGELGLLGMAFDPAFATNRRVYVYYASTGGGEGEGYRMVLARMLANASGDTFAFDREVLSFDTPGRNHVGGKLAFGPDGNLYLAVGDGAWYPDYAQDPARLNGKMLRIHMEDNGTYTIPATNPYAQGGGRPEIYARGFRNPFRFSFDAQSGALWVGDVGAGLAEEINRVELGGNYGWPHREGVTCMRPGDCGTGMMDPVFEYPNVSGAAVIGGHVYRGTAIPWLVGSYVFADFVTGKVWALEFDAEGKAQPRELLSTGDAIGALGVDAQGELYLVMTYSGTIRKLVAQAPPPPSVVPTLLSKTGCADPRDPRAPSAGQVAYDVNSPFWSDGAGKQRYLAIPDGTTLKPGADGDLEVPKGAVLRKDFLVGGQYVETRLFMHHADGTWSGYSYEWNDAQTDAVRVAGEKVKPVGGQDWVFPSGAQCMQCHTTAAGRTLGLELAQLDRETVYRATNRIAPQVATLAHVGLLAGPMPTVAPLPDPSGTASVESRARSYLHANCSMCHRPGGPGRGSADWRFATPWISEAGPTVQACNQAPLGSDLGIMNAKVVVPGQPNGSLVPLRMRAQNVHRMPPVGSRRVDAAGVALVEQWIIGLGPCP